LCIIKKEQIETPALLINLDKLEYNIEYMADYLKDKKAKLRPHYKTYKCPTIAHLQINAGAKGICCAKLGEAESLVVAGIKDVLILQDLHVVEQRSLLLLIIPKMLRISQKQLWNMVLPFICWLKWM